MPSGSVDVVVLDAYDQGQVPGDLLTLECLEQVARVLAPHGAFLANLTDRAPFALTRDVVSGLAACFRHHLLGAEPPTLKGRRSGNVLLVASHVDRVGSALLHRARSSASPYRVLAEGELRSSFGGGTPLHDPAAGSPSAAAPLGPERR